MLRKSLAPLTIAATLLIAGCTSAVDTAPPKLSEKQADRLARAIEGKVAGKPVSCVGRVGTTDRLDVISDDVLLYRASRDLVYVNTLSGSCNGISRGDTLVLQPMVSQYCSGAIARSVNLPLGIVSGSCALGQFVPYRTPER